MLDEGSIPSRSTIKHISQHPTYWDSKMALPLVCFIMGLTRFRQREIMETATRESTDVISEKLVNANASTFEYATTTFSLEKDVVAA
jgi:hypothetical protein